MKYTLLNRRKEVCLSNHIRFVNWMRRRDMQYWENNAEFMKGYAYRKHIFEKINLRCDSEQNFVEDLQINKILIVQSRYEVWERVKIWLFVFFKKYCLKRPNII